MAAYLLYSNKGGQRKARSEPTCLDGPSLCSITNVFRNRTLVALVYRSKGHPWIYFSKSPLLFSSWHSYSQGQMPGPSAGGNHIWLPNRDSFSTLLYWDDVGTPFWYTHCSHRKGGGSLASSIHFTTKGCTLPVKGDVIWNWRYIISNSK